nr:MAG TPA: hypothetical protein [Caudoviricetes sp.]DAQ99446.1 MAG TPA: hypothetical protein [Caudoviricetes sp.]
MIARTEFSQFHINGNNKTNLLETGEISLK